MIRFERTFDEAAITAIMTHPAVYDALADDFYPLAQHFIPHGGPAIYYLLAYDDDELLGLFMTHPINAVLWEAHVALLPNAWGPRAKAACLAFWDWLFDYTGAMRAIGFIPTSNRPALRYAKAVGMTEAGRLKSCYQKRGELHDLVIFEISKDLR